MFRLSITLVFAVLVSAQSLFADDSPRGSYRQPAIHGETIVIVAEGDLWKVSADGHAAHDAPRDGIHAGHLKDLIRQEPVVIPPLLPHPEKSFGGNAPDG